MIPERIPVVVVAICCIYAAGICATTLQSSVSTDPNDVVDLDTGGLPFPDDAVGELKHRVATAGDGDDPGAVDAPTPSPPQEPDAEPPPEPDAGPPQEPPPPDESGDAGGAAEQPAASQPDPDERGSTPTPGGLLGRLLGALGRLLSALGYWALVLAALLVLAAVGVRYRAAIKRALVGLLARAGILRRGAGPEELAPPSPSDEVTRAWYDVVSHLDVGLDRTKTPAEYADLAVAAGVDPAVVDAITRTFEEVRYGGQPATPQRVARATRARDRLLAQLERGARG